MNALAYLYCTVQQQIDDIETGLYPLSKKVEQNLQDLPYDFESYAWVDQELERRAALEEIYYNQQVPIYDTLCYKDLYDYDEEPFPLLTRDSLSETLTQTLTETDTDSDYDCDHIALTVDNYMLDANIYRKYRIRGDDVSNYFTF
jgi:hypothetical protein